MSVQPETPEQAPNPHKEALAPHIGAISLTEISVATASFYGADEHFIGKPLGTSKFNSLISRDGKPNEIVGAGLDPDAAIEDTIAKMHSLETVKSRPLVRISMEKGGASVDFTNLEHYAPKIAPSTETYRVPSYLDDILTDDSEGFSTYMTTSESQDWSTQLFAKVESFLQSNPKGAKLAKELKITSLKALTPEQAVKLSLATVQSLSKYSRDAAGEPDGFREDTMTTMDILQDGIDHADDPSWKGNGVCRNIASNVKAVFESLKDNQGTLSMLHNTYAVYTNGFDGAGYDNKRDNQNVLKFDLANGHAWNTFVTVDASGSANVVIIDATWALGTDRSGAPKPADYTLERMAAKARSLFEKSADKEEAFDGLSDYYNRLSRFTSTPGPAAREQRNEFITSEYLKAAKLALRTPREYPPNVPWTVTAGAFKMKNKLLLSEVRTLFDMSEAGWIDNFEPILQAYASKTQVDSLAIYDNELQGAIFDALGPEKTLACADRSVDFRIRLRSLRPDALPPIDPANSADQKEIITLGQSGGFMIINASNFGEKVKKRLRSSAPDAATYEAVISGHSDYDLLKYYLDFSAQLRGK